MKSLQEFASNDNQPLFSQAKNLPDFFQHNLVDPARVVKVFTNDPQANIRIFYYQYLKLCFELDNVNYEFYINKIEQIINNQGFKFIFYQDDDPSLFSDLQFKNLIMQFFGVLGDGNITIDAALNRYPVMDTVFIYFFRAFLILTGKAQTLDSYVERDQLLQYLCSYFQVEITLHDKCIKFVQTDIFAYEQDPKEVFMAFMDYDKVQNQSQLQPPQQDGASYFDQHPPNALETNEFVSNVQEHIQSPAYLHSHQQIAENVGFQTNANHMPPVSLKIQNQPANNSINYPASNNSSRRGNTEVNQSYIASEFVDYTSGHNQNFLGLQQKATLKESGSIDNYKLNQTANIKSESFGSNFEQNYRKPDSKPSGFKIEQNSYANQQTKINPSYGYSQQAEKSYSLNNNLSSYVSKTNFSTEIPFKMTELQEKKYIPQNDWQPTKDPGFTQNYTTNQYLSSTTYQKPVSPTNSHQPNLNVVYDQTDYYKSLEQKKPSSQSLHTSDSLPQFQAKKPTSSQASKPLPSYIPSYQPSSYQSSYNSNYQSGINYQNQYNQPITTKPASGKNPFGLNVSLEFTNSFTMKAMNEPFKSNVATIRQRARNFRNSLVSYIK